MAMKQIQLLQYKLTEQGILGESIEIRLRYLQKNKWLHENLTEIWPYEETNKFGKNIIGQVLCIAKKYGISLNVANNVINYKVEGGVIPILDILKENYRQHKESLKRKGILFLEQIIYEQLLIMRN